MDDTTPSKSPPVTALVLDLDPEAAKLIDLRNQVVSCPDKDLSEKIERLRINKYIIGAQTYNIDPRPTLNKNPFVEVTNFRIIEPNNVKSSQVEHAFDDGVYRVLSKDLGADDGPTY
ncbi:hypothetical protein DASC09_055370 [Saccharomycopsis crataegensis]|uniref:Uncharacterized protein n=1 Tax=Saccharomycopsis crataegensis TaxID=43959 RepID=A0AAV5QTM8_9ASCO|nr:hypothetical protein DASC09_055370 [Saccharomycopsis crataegensis]